MKVLKAIIMLKRFEKRFADMTALQNIPASVGLI